MWRWWVAERPRAAVLLLERLVGISSCGDALDLHGCRACASLCPPTAPAQNGVRHATLAGANPAQREDALHAFLHDPDCVVLTVSRLA